MATVRFLVLFCVSLNVGAAEELTTELVFDILSRRLDNVIQEVDTFKSDVAEIRLDVKRIEKRIVNIEANVPDITQVKENNRISKSVMHEKLKRQSKALHKMLATEKYILRETVDHFENMFSEFQSDVKSQLMNVSVENLLENLDLRLTGHKKATNAALLEMNLELKTMMNEADNRMENATKVVKQILSDSLKKIKEVGESFEAKMNSNVENTKRELSTHFTSEIANLTTELKALERKQGTQEEDIGGRIRDLTHRMSVEELISSDLSRRISVQEVATTTDVKASIPDCDCDYYPGGCTISKPAPEGLACVCLHKSFWTCGGIVGECSNLESSYCKRPDYSVHSCLQGGGDCEGYNTATCDCDYHPGGCSISQAPPPYTACKCLHKGFWACGGEITRCKDKDSQYCKTPDFSKSTCLQGGGDCDGY